MFFKSQTRGEARALVCAVLIGAGLGVAVGGAYFAGGVARAQDPDARMGRLARAAAAGFTEDALQSEAAAMPPGVLAAARRQDPYTVAGGAQRDRQAALAAARAIAHQESAGTSRGAAVQPFRFSGLLESSRDLDCLTAAVYYEARGETAAGQEAVAQVVLNRTRHPAFPKTVCGVVYQGLAAGGCQFSFVCDGSMRRGREPAAWSRARAVAARALGGYVMADVGPAVSFHVARLGTPWGASMIRVAQVGGHVFYRMGARAGSIRGGVYTAENSRPPAPEQVSRPVYGPPTGAPTADGAGPAEVAAVDIAPPPVPTAAPAEAPAKTDAAEPTAS